MNRSIQRMVSRWNKQKNGFFTDLYLGTTGIEWLDATSEFVYNQYKKVIRFHEMVKRMIFWAIKMRHNYDWDGAFLYDTMYLKLDRMYNCFHNHGHLMWNSSPETKGMRRVRECRALAHKLANSIYSRHVTRVHEKYKQNRHDSISNLLKDYYPNAKYIDNDMYMKFIREAYKRDSNERKYDKKRLFTLLDKHLDGFWD